MMSAVPLETHTKRQRSNETKDSTESLDKPTISSSLDYVLAHKDFYPEVTADDHVLVFYPGGVTEEFLLLAPMKDDYEPVRDLAQSVSLVAADFPTLFGNPEASTAGTSALAAGVAIPLLETMSNSSLKWPLYHLLSRSAKKKDYPLLRQHIQLFNACCEILFKCRETIVTSEEPASTQQMMDFAETFMNAPESEIPVHIKHLCGTMMRQVADKPLSYEQTVVLLDQVYARTVTDVDSLRQYKGFSKEVYGETRHPIINDIIKMTKLQAGDTFLDLGSGIGNVVLQVSAETRAKSYGIELLEKPASYARLQLSEYRARMLMLGRTIPTVHLRQGDFLEDQRVHKVIQRADVVFVNNYAFESSLNHGLMQLFLGMKEGATIISFAAFRSLDYTIMDYNMNDIASILTVRKTGYRSGGVSWTASPGEYFVHTVDRGPLRKFIRRRESCRSNDSKRASKR